MKKIKSEITDNRKDSVSGYAPSQMNMFSRCVYTLLRMTHLIVTGAVLPLSIIYVQRSGLTSVFVYAVAGWFIAFGAMLWILLYIALEQYSYPLGLKGSLSLTGGILLNGFSGYTISDLNIYYGAYQVVISALCAQFLFLTMITIRYYYLKITGAAEGREMMTWYFIFLTVVSLSIGVFLLIMIKPVVVEFSQARGLLLLCISGFFFLYHVFSDCAVMWKGSIFNKSVMAFPLRNQLHEKWSAFSAVTIIISLLTSAVIGLWDLS